MERQVVAPGDQKQVSAAHGIGRDAQPGQSLNRHQGASDQADDVGSSARTCRAECIGGETRRGQARETQEGVEQLHDCLRGRRWQRPVRIEQLPCAIGLDGEISEVERRALRTCEVSVRKQGLNVIQLIPRRIEQRPIRKQPDQQLVNGSAVQGCGQQIRTRALALRGQRSALLGAAEDHSPDEHREFREKKAGRVATLAHHLPAPASRNLYATVPRLVT